MLLFEHYIMRLLDKVIQYMSTWRYKHKTN